MRSGLSFFRNTSAALTRGGFDKFNRFKAGIVPTIDSDAKELQPIEVQVSALDKRDPYVMQYYLAAKKKWEKPELHPEVYQSLGKVLEAVTSAALPFSGLRDACVQVDQTHKSASTMINPDFRLIFKQSSVVSTGFVISQGVVPVGQNHNPYQIYGILITPIGSLNLYSHDGQAFMAPSEVEKFNDSLKAALKKSKFFPEEKDGALHLKHAQLLHQQDLASDVWAYVTHYNNTGVQSSNEDKRNNPIKIAIPEGLLNKLNEKYVNREQESSRTM